MAGAGSVRQGVRSDAPGGAGGLMRGLDVAGLLAVIVLCVIFLDVVIF